MAFLRVGNGNLALFDGLKYRIDSQNHSFLFQSIFCWREYVESFTYLSVVVVLLVAIICVFEVLTIYFQYKRNAKYYVNLGKWIYIG